MTPNRLAVGGVVLAAGLALSAGCTADRGQSGFRDSAVPAGSFQLVAFNSCDDAMAKLKQAAKEYVGPYGFGFAGGPEAAVADGGIARDGAAPPAAAAEGGKAAPGGGTGSAPNFTGTNTHEAGVDEPDIVKTDGRRIITISGGVLHVVDAASRQVTGRLDLRQGQNDPVMWNSPNLMLAGDRVLVLINGGHYLAPPPGAVIDSPARPGPDGSQVSGPRLLLVELAGGPRVTGSYTMDGNLVDARQTGATIRVVVSSFPRIAFPNHQRLTDQQRIVGNKTIIDKAGPDDWLPRYSTTSGGRTSTGRVDCGAVRRPAVYSGTSMVTVLTFDLGRDALGNGEPVTIVADGNTVYSNGPSLYVANDQRWRAVMFDGSQRAAPEKMPEERTELYKFDTSAPGQPRYVASGSVPGYLVNQYAMSEWNGHLRVATTTGQTWGRDARSSSAVYILAQRNRTLQETGKVTGLGKGERIYAVRFTGPIGYVVTFRQTDPLYTVDLRDATRPRVTGELKITGYSAYLHPAGDNRLIGIGQEATERGRVQGTQVSLFDVSDLTKPTRVAQYHAKFGHSEAEFDPHAFLYHQSSGLLVVPLNVYEAARTPEGGALVLQVSESALTEVGFITHPATQNQMDKFPGQIRRSLIIDDVLWTVSAGGLEATSMRGLDTLAWVPLT
jgi:hypothetical protein